MDRFVPNIFAQVDFDTFINRIYYGMTEFDLVREFGDSMQYYDPFDTTSNNTKHNMAVLLHKLNLTDNFHIIADTFSDYEVNIQIGSKIVPFTISVDSLSRTVNTMVFCASSLDYSIQEINWNDIFQSFLGKPDSLGNYYYDNCLINIICSTPEDYFNNFIVTIALTKHKMTANEFIEKGILQVPMQNEFLGIKMYSPYNKVKRMMLQNDHCAFLAPKNELFYKNINFAGYLWDICNFTFNNKNQFTCISFLASLPSEEIMKEKYYNIKKRLQAKYSLSNGYLPLVQDDDWASDKEMSITLGDYYSPILCHLKVFYTKKIDENMPYQLFLQYYDNRFVENPNDDL